MTEVNWLLPASSSLKVAFADICGYGSPDLCRGLIFQIQVFVFDGSHSTLCHWFSYMNIVFEYLVVFCFELWRICFHSKGCVFSRSRLWLILFDIDWLKHCLFSCVCDKQKPDLEFILWIFGVSLLNNITEIWRIRSAYFANPFSISISNAIFSSFSFLLRYVMWWV